MNTMKVAVLDIVLFRTVILCLFSGTVAYFSGQTFVVEKSSRAILAFRSGLGTIGYACFTFGLSLVPLVIV